MTALGHFESSYRFKTLPHSEKSAAGLGDREAIFPAARIESFPLRETGH
jgi:hypothetical protein